jgi:hypothetical protein
VASEGTDPFGTKTGGIFSASGGALNHAIVVPPNGGDVGFGTNAPSTKLHIAKPTSGAIRIEDGTKQTDMSYARMPTAWEPGRIPITFMVAHRK